MYCDKRLSSLFFSLFLSLMGESLFFFHSFVSVRQKFIPRPPVIKIQRNSVLMRIFLFFLQAQKRSKRRGKGHERTRSHSHHHHSYRHIFSSLLASSHHQHQQKHTALLLHYHSFYATFCDFTQGEREKVCVCVRERERRSLSESERRVCSFYACGL